MAKTKINWADAVWNPVTGCSKLSEGCRNCYAERMSKRLAGRCGYPKDDPFNVTLHPEKIIEPLKWEKPRRIFVNSMSDLFHDGVPDDWILAIFVAMGLTYENTKEMKEVSPGHKVAMHKAKHTFMILTKRPERMKNFINRLTSNEPDEEWDEKAHYFATQIAGANGAIAPSNAIITFCLWLKDGMPGLWLGISVENQAAADERIPLLIETPAETHFISIEPLLGSIDLKLNDRHNDPSDCPTWHDWCNCSPDWVIVGGESGPRARPTHPDWVRSLRNQCQAANVPFFFKQWGEWLPNAQEFNCNPGGVDFEQRHELVGDVAMCRVGKKKAGRILDGRTWDEMPRIGGKKA